MIDIKSILRLSSEFIKFARSFDLVEFDSLPPFRIRNGIKTFFSPERKEMLQNLTKIGMGGSRNTYVLSSKKALKVAKNERGENGNKNEFEILTRYQSIFLPKAFNRAKDYSWIIVELVRPIANLSEILQMTGIDGDLFQLLVNEREYSSSFEEAILKEIKIETFQDLKNSSERISNLESYINHPFFKELDKIIDELNLDVGELSMEQNLGKSASGHLVLLDIGELNN